MKRVAIGDNGSQSRVRVLIESQSVALFTQLVHGGTVAPLLQTHHSMLN